MPKDGNILQVLLVPDPAMAAYFQRLGLKRFLPNQFSIGRKAPPLIADHVVINAEKEEKARREQIAREEQIALIEKFYACLRSSNSDGEHGNS